MGARSWSDLRNKPEPSVKMQLQSPCLQQLEQKQCTNAIATTTTTTTASIMYSAAAIQERQRLEAGAYQDHLVQVHSVQTDMVLDLPHTIALPDGEEHYHCNAKHLQVRDPEQQDELTRTFIRPPPNRTVQEVDSLPPFRSNSVGVLQKPGNTTLSQITRSAPLVMRSHSMSSSSQSGRQNKDYVNSVSNSDVTSHSWIPSLASGYHCSTNSSGFCGIGSSSVRTNSSKPVTNISNDGSDSCRSPCSDSFSVEWDTDVMNKQNHNTGV